MKRRVVVTGLGLAAAGALAACSRESGGGAAGAPSGRRYNWKLVTTWPPNFPGLGTGAANLAKLIEQCSGGRIRVKVYGAGELVPPFEVFDAVSTGTAELGHGGAYYWKGKINAASFFSAVPFGLSAMEMNGWLFYGGGLELWREAYAPFGVLPMPCGNSGVQMGGWFRKEIASVADLKGLKMRIPGLGGEVLARAGGTPVTLSGQEIFTALQTGAIDATEWVGPYNDLAFGLYQAARYYYYPGWQEPGTVLEALINKQAFESLPEDLQAIVTTCCRAVNDDMLAEFTARNHEALATLVEKHGVQLRRFPDDVLRELKRVSEQVVQETAAKDPLSKKVYDSFKAFERKSAPYIAVSEQAMLATRSL